MLGSSVVMQRRRRRSVDDTSVLVLCLLFLQILLEVPKTEARFVGAKNKKIHKFFDDDSYDSFLDLPEEPEAAGFHSSTSTTLASTKQQTMAPEYQEWEKDEEEEEEEEVLDSVVSSEESKESGNSSSSSSSSSSSTVSDILQDTKKEYKVDPCLAIRCRIGRVCTANDNGDGFSGAWCVCAEADHCVNHGRGKRRKVCGSDGLFYSSHCEMHRMACVRNQRIRINHNESFCLIRHHQHHQQHLLQPTADGNINEEFHSALRLPTKSEVSSTVKDDRPTQSSVTTVGMETGVLSLSTTGQCTDIEYWKFVENLLQADCTRTGRRNCADYHNRHQPIDDVMFGYYDNDSDQQLDVTELDAAESRDHLSELSTTCRLRDLIRFGDKDLDHTLSLEEFYAALRVSRVLLDEALDVFLTSATVGTSLELKCDVSGTTDYVWKRNGQVVGAGSDVADKIKVFGDGSLYISDVALYHVGNYSCQDRHNDDVVQVHMVSVRVPPIVQVSPKTRFLASGATVTIRCHVEGIPIPDVSWNANEMPLSDRPDHYSLLHDGLTLQIREADYTDDTGTFKCRANNFVGSSEDVATVFVEKADALRTAYSDELYQLFVVFHDEGFGVYEPGHCHIHHVVKGDFKLAPRDDVNGQQPVNVLCGQSNATSCVWGAAVNVKNRFIYVTQPDLHRVVVVEVQDRLNPVEIIPTDGSPVEIAYVEHLDQVWLSCADQIVSSSSRSNASESLSKTLLVIQRASADVRHSIIHTQPVTDKFDVVKHLFLPPANTFQQTSDYGYVVREEGGVGGGGSDGRLALHKIDLNSMKYVKRLAAVEKSGCIPNRLAFIPLAGKIFANCDRSSSDVSSNVSSFCFTIDYVTDRVVAADSAVESCGDPYVSPDSRHLVIVKDNRKSLDVYRIYDDGSMDLAFGETVDMRIGGVTFFATERGYDLFAKAVDQSTVVYMNLASGHMETVKEGVGHWKSSDDQSLPTKGGRFLPIVSGGVFSDYLLTPSSTDALYVIDGRRRQVQCEWQDVKHATVVTWVQVWNR